MYVLKSHNPDFNRWFSAITKHINGLFKLIVTILILIDGFLQFQTEVIKRFYVERHNPYFNRWFSAISFLLPHHNPNFCHNPYFNRWFSAIYVS